MGPRGRGALRTHEHRPSALAPSTSGPTTGRAAKQRGPMASDSSKRQNTHQKLQRALSVHHESVPHAAAGSLNPTPPALPCTVGNPVHTFSPRTAISGQMMLRCCTSFQLCRLDRPDNQHAIVPPTFPPSHPPIPYHSMSVRRRSRGRRTRQGYSDGISISNFVQRTIDTVESQLRTVRPPCTTTLV